jgi:hypothetical protein
MYALECTLLPILQYSLGKKVGSFEMTCPKLTLNEILKRDLERAGSDEDNATNYDFF